ncbi:hypothetical protein KQI84_11265 [bacterium]|nr:hypothetical protein [bacterium]
MMANDNSKPMFGGRPEGLTPLGRLSQYMNFRRVCDEPPTMAMEDHRAVLVAAWAAQQQGLFGEEPPLLFRFDAHPDVGERPRPWAHEAAQLTDLDSVHAVANDQRHDDGGWVISALQFGLAADVATFFVHDYHRFPGDDGAYTDHRDRRHEMWSYSTLSEWKAGLDADSAKAWRLQARLDRALRTGSLWVDFDLDFATAREDDDAIRLWTEEEWSAAFGRSELEILAKALAGANLVTIASEPVFCLGLKGAGTVAERLKRLPAPIFGQCFGAL